MMMMMMMMMNDDDDKEEEEEEDGEDEDEEDDEEDEHEYEYGPLLPRSLRCTVRRGLRHARSARGCLERVQLGGEFRKALALLATVEGLLEESSSSTKGKS